MSNVQITNNGVVQVEIQDTVGKHIQTLERGGQFSCTVVDESIIQIMYDGTSSPMLVVIDYVSDVKFLTPSTSSVALALYSDAGVYVEAKTALSLMLSGQIIFPSAPVVSDGTTVAPNIVRGVKCGEIIIYPPA